MLFKKNNTKEALSVSELKIINSETPAEIREAFNSLSVNISFLPIEDSCKKIAITGANTGDGKTYAAINLAISLAKNLAGKKILLVDMDMRAADLSALCKLHFNFSDSESGISEFLSEKSKEINILKSNVENLSVLLCGKEVYSPTAIINSPKLSEFIANAEKEFDYIIIDTPAINEVSDAKLLASAVNGYILTARKGITRLQNLGKAEEELKALDANILGIIFTGDTNK
jgi:capsular exopolysaccharide synthesis family protein